MTVKNQRKTRKIYQQYFKSPSVLFRPVLALFPKLLKIYFLEEKIQENSEWDHWKASDIGNQTPQSRAPGTRVSLRTSPSKEGTRRHFLNKKILWTSFLDPSFFHHGEGANYGLLSPPLLKRDENFRDNKHANQKEKMNEPRLKIFSGRFDISLVALCIKICDQRCELNVDKERALKPSHQLFITMDQKVCLIPELQFPIPTLK